ncbi:hypothetical protein EDB84DRAFT_1446900 [Lactarius hengduanensis]|nr:hypothetical protein EDB84DRAFT_1446900 [Lactarius hengduanensis]
MVERVGVQSLSHIKHQLEYYYWYHWSLFPVHFGQHKLPKGTYDELLGMLAHGGIDVLISKTSTLWLNDDQIQKTIGLVQDAKVTNLRTQCTLERYLTELKEAWVDEYILEPVWEGLMTRMVDEWVDLILWSMLAFLLCLVWFRPMVIIWVI